MHKRRNDRSMAPWAELAPNRAELAPRATWPSLGLWKALPQWLGHSFWFFGSQHVYSSGFIRLQHTSLQDTHSLHVLAHTCSQFQLYFYCICLHSREDALFLNLYIFVTKIDKIIVKSKSKKNEYDTRCSQAVSHPSTNQAQRCLTWQI